MVDYLASHTMLKRVYEYYIYKISKFYKETLKANDPCYFANAIFSRL